MQVAVLHSCRHPNVVTMRGAWLGQGQVFMAQELLQTDLRKALSSPEMQDEMCWAKRWASERASAGYLPLALQDRLAYLGQAACWRSLSFQLGHVKHA